MSATAMHLERECTYAFDGLRLADLVGRLAAGLAGGTATGAPAYASRGHSTRSMIHLYSARTTALERFRLRLRRDREGAPAGRYDHKVMRRDGHNQEHSTPWLRGDALLEFLDRLGPVVSAFRKDRLKLRYTSADGEELVIGVDRLLAFDPSGAETLVGPIWHIELEGEDPDAPASFCNSSYFAEVVAPMLVELTYETSKWLWARTAIAHPRPLPCRSVGDLAGLCDVVFDAPFPDLTEIAGLGR